jgi:hypothetical protein
MSSTAFIGKFLHHCPFAGDALIDEFCEEFLHCHCFGAETEVLALQDRLAIQLDFNRGPW